MDRLVNNVPVSDDSRGWSYFYNSYYIEGKLKKVKECKRDIDLLDLDQIEILLSDLRELAESRDEKNKKQVKSFLEKTYSNLEKACKKDIKRYFSIIQAISKKLNLEISQLFRHDYHNSVSEYKGKKDSIFLPLDTEYVVCILEYFLETEKNEEAGKLLKSALLCKDMTQNNSQPKSTEINNKTYNALVKRIEEDNQFKELAEKYYPEWRNQSKIIKKYETKDLKEKIIEKKNEQCSESEDSEIERLKDQIKKMSSEVVKAENARKIAEQRLSKQILINEDLISANRSKVTEKDSIIEGLRKTIDSKNIEIEEKETIVEKQKHQINNLCADLENEKKQNELLSKNKNEDDYQTKIIAIIDLLSQMDNPLYNLYECISCLRDSSSCEEGIMDLMNDSYMELLSAFEIFDVTPIGQIGSVMPYDYEFHELETCVSKGTPVRVLNIGWKTSDSVIKRAIVREINE